jgi:hypothetical protein
VDSGSIWVAGIKNYPSLNGRFSSILPNGGRIRRGPWLSKSKVVVVVRRVSKQKAGAKSTLRGREIPTRLAKE